MKKQINYPKIQQFRNVVSTIRRESSFVGLDADENPIYNDALQKPILTFKGTVKLHGTNAAVCYNEVSGFWAQSRSRVITPESDNAGFAFFAYAEKDELMKVIGHIEDSRGIDLSKNTISIYGEWAGKSIQKGVAISEIDKSFFIFGVKISPFDENEKSYWIDISKDGIRNIDSKIFDIYGFETYSVEINFNQPELIQQTLIDITNKVEEKCPVAASFGKNGIGEGVVWSCEYNGTVHRFKVKGEKHSVSKVKTLAPVDVEKVNNIKEFIEYSVTKNRFEQAMNEVFGTNEPSISGLGNLIRWIIKDINKEENDVMIKNGLYSKDVNKYIAPKVKEMFLKLL